MVHKIHTSIIDERQAAEREYSPLSSGRVPSRSYWSGLSPRANGSSCLDTEPDHGASRRSIPPDIGREELAPMVVTGRFDHDGTKRSLPAQPCMEPFDSDPFQESGPYQGYTDADFCRVLLNEPSSSSLREENCFEDTQPFTVDEMLQSQDTSLTLGAVPAAHELITEQSFDALKLDLSDTGSNKANRRINSVIDALKVRIFGGQRTSGCTSLNEAILFDSESGVAKRKETNCKTMNAIQIDRTNRAVDMFNTLLQVKHDRRLDEMIEIASDIFLNQGTAINKLEKKAGNYKYMACFRRGAILRTNTNTSAFLKELKSNPIRLRKWNDAMRGMGIQNNIIPEPSQASGSQT